MKKCIVFLLMAIFSSASYAGDYNPFFADYQNQVALNFGYGVDSGILVPPPARFVPFNILHIQYSQPTTFFTLPARQSLNIAQTLGHGTRYGWHWDEYTIPIAFASQDVALLHGCDWYFATGVGVGFQAQQNERIGSKLLFQFKITGGYRLTDTVSAEIFALHFSNGNTAHENHSYAFYGLGLLYNF